VKKEPGTLLYLMHVSQTEQDDDWLYERYVDAAACEVHRCSAMHGAVVAALNPLIAEPAEIHWLDLLASKGLPQA